MWVAAGVLVIGLIFTLLFSFYIKSEIDTAAVKEFNFVCNEIQLNITDRLNANAMLLYSGTAFFYASQEVSRDEWRAYITNLRIEQQMPGTQGVGFSRMIHPEQLEQHIQQIRAEGFSEYTVQPDGPRDIYSSIIFIEPFSGRNLRAFGFDMFSEPVRRAAMERARDENQAALSGKVILVQETDSDIQPGTLMYVPVYRHGMPTQTVDERRAALLGWVYSPYRMKDLMQGILGNYRLKNADRHVALQIYDGNTTSTDMLLFDSEAGYQDTGNLAKGMSKIIQVTYFGRPWTLKFSLVGDPFGLADYSSFWLALASSTSISLLLAGLVASMLRTAQYLQSIKQLAESDELTSVYNRRKILALAEGEFIRSKRTNHPMAILMIDLNFFKSINDNYGHAAGDRALRVTSSALSETLRKNIDQIGRYGGDEFIIILAETVIDQVQPIITRLRNNVAQKTAGLIPGMGHITLSIGASVLDGTTETLAQMLDQADHRMYVNKNALKNILPR